MYDFHKMNINISNLLNLNENILIDTSPDIRQQLLRHKIKKINKVLFSHMHGDQTHGINDLRIFYIKKRKPIKRIHTYLMT